MQTLNRAIVILRKKQPYLDWIKNLPDPDSGMTLEDLNRELSFY